MNIRLRATCLMFLAFVACSGSGTSGGSRSQPAKESTAASSNQGGSLWDQMAREREAKADRAKMEEARTAGASTLPAGWKQKIDKWWGYYMAGDTGWPEARKEWLALGGDAPMILAENLLRAYVFAFDAGSRVDVNRARVELIDLKAYSLPMLVLGVSRGLGDSVVRNQCTDLIGAMGDDGVPEIAKAWDDANAKGKWELVRALRKIHTPATVPMLSKVATSGESFEPRIDAIQGLGELKDPRGYPAVIRCLADSDRSVRKFAAHFVSAFERMDAVPPLVDSMEAAEKEGDVDSVNEAYGSLVRLTGRKLGADSRAWRGFLASPDWRSGAGK